MLQRRERTCKRSACDAAIGVRGPCRWLIQRPIARDAAPIISVEVEVGSTDVNNTPTWNNIWAYGVSRRERKG